MALNTNAQHSAYRRTRNKLLLKKREIELAFGLPAEPFFADVYVRAEPVEDAVQIALTETLDDSPIFINLPMNEKIIPAGKRNLAYKLAVVLAAVVKDSPEVAPYLAMRLMQTTSDILRENKYAPLTVKNDRETVYVSHYQDNGPFSEECIGVYCKSELFPHIADLLPRFFAQITN